MIDLASEGLTDREISQELGISEGTVATYWERIRAKLGPHHRSELVARCAIEAADRKAGELKTEIRELKSQLKLTQNERDHARQLSEFAPTPLLTIRCDGRIDDLNPAAEALLGYRREDLAGREFTELVPMSLAVAYRRELAALCGDASGKSFPIHRCLRLRDASGRRFAARLSLVRRELPNGRLLACSLAKRSEEARLPNEMDRRQASG